MGPEFFQTGMGHRFYEATMPQLVRAVNRMAKAQERANRLKELELRIDMWGREAEDELKKELETKEGSHEQDTDGTE